MKWFRAWIYWYKRRSRKHPMPLLTILWNQHKRLAFTHNIITNMDDSN